MRPGSNGFRGRTVEGQMSGSMVTTDNGNGFRDIYMVNVDDCERAGVAVNTMMGGSNAQALAPIPDRRSSSTSSRRARRGSAPR